MHLNAKVLLFSAFALAACLLIAPVSAVAGHHEEAKAAKAEAKAKTKKGDPLRDPSLAIEVAPAQYRVKFETTVGDVILQVNREWAPYGADRFYNLVKIGFYDDVGFFRVIDGFMVQFGLSGDPKITRGWSKARIRDDKVAQSNKRGFVSFAKTGQPHSRTTQLFINLADNKNLDGMGFAPFAQVVEGMDIVDKIYKVGEGKPRGPGPAQNRVKILGNEYLKKNFPQLDYLKKATIVD